MDEIKLVCQALHRTYDASQLELLASTPIQDIFLDVVEKYRRSGKGNTILQQLIWNFYKVERPIIQYLSGPRTLSLHYSEKYEKTVYVFGEWHGWKDDCRRFKKRNHVMEIQEYLYDLLQTTPAFIDLYIELPSFEGISYDKDELVQYPRKYYMGRLLTKFENCIQTGNRSSTECDLARVHYIDIRTVNTRGTNRITQFISLANTAYIKDDVEMLRKLLLSNKDMLKSLNRSRKSALAYILKYGYKDNKQVMKETSKSYLRADIEKFFGSYVPFVLEEEYAEIKLWTGHLLRVDHLSDENVLTASYNFVQAFIPTITPSVDQYTLSRIFKTFDTSKRKGYGRYNWLVPSFLDVNEKENQPEEPRNIIIYAGDAHSQLYRDFFTRVGFEEREFLSEEKSMGERCLDMRDFPQPFFSEM